MLRNKIGIGVLLLVMLLVDMVLIPAVNGQNENDYSVTAEEAFKHANAQIIDFIAGDTEFEGWKGASIDPKPLELYDPNGQKLYYQFSVYKNNGLIGRIDVGANKTLGQSIQVIELTPALYNTTEAVKKSIEIAKNEYPDGEIKSTEMVVYCYPKIGAMTVIKDKASGNEHRIFIDVYTLEVIPDKPATETESGTWSIFERRLQNGVDENLKSWQASDQYTNSIEQELAGKGICISVPIILDDYLNSEVSNVHYSYYNYFFGLNSYGNTVITRYGKLPVLETDEQKENWNSTLEKLGNEIKDIVVSKYMYPHGEVVTCGTNNKGYFVILFKYGNVDESLMNEIYSLIDSSAKKMGIRDIPVEFGYGIYYRQKIPLSQDGLREYEFGGSIENLSESDIHAIEEYMKQKQEPAYKSGDIANYGIIPLLKDEKEYNEWGDKLMLVFEQIREKMEPYMDKGQIGSYGVGATRLEVGIPENLSFEEKTAIAKESYQVIDGEARKQNVTCIPVAFGSEGNLSNVTENPSVEQISNLTENSNENESSKTNSTPGFGLLGGLTCLYGGWKLRKR